MSNAKRLMVFNLSDTKVIVMCHPKVAKEILNSSVFAVRPVDETVYGLMFNRNMGFVPIVQPEANQTLGGAEANGRDSDGECLYT